MWVRLSTESLMMASLGFADAFIRDRVSNNCSHATIAVELQQRFPSNRGLSARSVRRYCNVNGICRSSRLTPSEVDDAVETAVSLVGPSYGRRTLTGLLRSEGIVVGEQRVRASMRRITPSYIEQRRRHTYRQFNPTPYYAEYYGHKIHIDQNEKLVRFGVTHVAASDGYSGKLLGVVTMPVKNPILIYEDLFRPIIISEGLWDQVRVDCGREFALLLFVQRLLSRYRTNTSREPYLQTRSTQNHLAERHWVEVNSRVNFPIKRALINMQQNSVIDMDCPTTKYCVSLMTGKLCQIGIQKHIQAWNNHRIPGQHRGVPNQLAVRNNRVAQIHSYLVPDVSNAVSLYQASGGRLGAESGFGVDPLAGSPELIQERQAAMESNIPSPEELFGWTVNGLFQPFSDSLNYMIDISTDLTRFL